jgi:hypothetical protein
MRTFFGDNIVLKKNLFWFLEIHLHLVGIRVTNTCLKQEIMKTKKMGLKYSFESPNL